MTLNKKQLLFLVTFLLLTVTASAFEHIGSTVNFMEYEPKVIQKNLHRQKPFFLLFPPGPRELPTKFLKHFLMSSILEMLEQLIERFWMDVTVWSILQRSRTTRWEKCMKP